MSRLLVSILCTLLWTFWTIPAYAELLAVDQYLSVKLGYSGIFANPVKIKGTLLQPQSGYKEKGYISTPALSFAVGTYYATQYIAIRGETEYAIRFNAGSTIASLPTTRSPSKLTLTNTIQTVLFNVFIDVNTNTFFVPYIGAGIGVGLIDSKYSIDTASKKKLTVDFAWQVNLGAAFYIVPSLAIDIQARYSYFGEPRYGSGNPVRMIYTATGIDAFIGIRYTL